MASSTPVVLLKNSSSTSNCELKWNEVLSYLANLSLTWVTIGEYMVVMSSKIDVTIGGEPYLARQLWFNVKSGKIISRIWDQTVAVGKVISVAEFSEACRMHFRGRPCIGYPSSNDVHNGEDFVISQTPVQRKVSRICQKVLEPDSNGSNEMVQSCEECLKLGVKNEERTEKEAFMAEMFFEDALQEEGEQESIQTERKKHVQQNLPVTSVDQSANSHDKGQNISSAVESLERSKRARIARYSYIDKALMRQESQNKTDNSLTEQSKNQNLFSCEHCGETNAGRLSHEQHMYTHLGSPMHMKCGVCETIVLCGRFANHMLTLHGQKGKFSKQCPWCEKSFSAGWLEGHAIKIHLYGRFLCWKCPFSANFGKELISHIDKEHEDKFAKCPICNEEHELKELESHYKNCEAQKFSKGSKTCPTCGKDVSKYDFKRHNKIHLREQADKEQDSSHNDLYHHCDKCDRKFNEPYQLKYHIRSEHDKIAYTCSLCPMTFDKIWTLRHHKRAVHSTEEKYKCSYCGIQLSSVSRREAHERRHKEPKYLCRFCPKKFRHPESLEIHERVHTGEKPFACSSCPLTFSRANDRTKHNTLVHCTDEKYKCKFCGIRKSNLKHLKLHERVHEEPQFQCSFCPKKLKSEGALESHERNHTGEKPFKCSTCGNSYVSINALAQHEKGAHKIPGPKGGKTGWRGKSKTEKENE